MAIQVLIADDDYLVLEDLHRMVDWDELGFHIAALAQTGERALSLAKKIQPQLVITDVEMPGMDGLTFLEKLRESVQGVRFIVISSFDSFQYVKRALRGGAEDYLLKNEISPQILTEKLLVIRNELEKSRHHEAAVARLLLSDYTLSSLALDEIAVNYPVNDRLLVSMTEMVNRKLNWFILKERRPLTLIDFKNEERRAEGNLLLQHFHEVREQFDMAAYSFSCYDCLYLGFEPAAVGQETYRVRRYARRLREAVAASDRKELLVFYLPGREKLSDLRERMQQSEEVMQFYTAFPAGQCMDLSLLWKEKVVHVNQSFDDSLLFYVNEESEKKFYEALCAWLKHAFLQRDIKTLGQFYVHIRQKLEDMGAQPVGTVAYFETADDVADDLRRGFKEAAAAAVDRYQDVSGAVGRAISCIRRSFANPDLSIDQIAEEAGLSAGRLSVIFKEETGSTVVEFLTEERIRQAVWLLKNTNLRIYEVSQRTGYNSSQYFSKVFYKKTGKKPIEYK